MTSIRRYYFLGIGGIGMSGLARILHQQGHQVAGCDRSQSSLTHELQSQGIRVDSDEQLPDDLNSYDIIVKSTAIPADHPVLLAVDQAPVISRGQLLADLMVKKRGIAVAGCHGKTSTSAVLAHILSQSHLGCSYAVGGVLQKQATNARWSAVSPYLVAESDESDCSFLLLKPPIAIVTNIDQDHPEAYGHRFEHLVRAFAEFMQEPYQHKGLFVGIDCSHARALVAKQFPEAHTYGFDTNADHRIISYQQRGWYSTLVTAQHGRESTWYYHHLPGRHLAQNVAAVISVCRHLGLDDDSIAEGLASFMGVQRRLEHLSSVGAIEVISDYGHHPDEIRATLNTVRQLYPGHALHVIFEPHRYSRTAEHAVEFAEALSQADRGWLTPIYPASELPMEGVSSATIVGYMTKEHQARWSVVELDDAIDRALDDRQSPSTLLILGAGKLDGYVREYLAQLDR